jgi:CO/xanthine dehydrogenase FAD-binding subunit
MVLDATYHLAGPGGSREVRARDFYAGDGIERNVKRPEEILTHVTLPAISRTLQADYSKLRVRDTFDYPMMSVAASLHLDGGKVDELHVVVNAVDTRPIAFEDYTASLRGRKFDKDFIDEVSVEVRDRSRPVKNLVLSTAYRKKMIGVYLARILQPFLEG